MSPKAVLYEKKVLEQWRRNDLLVGIAMFELFPLKSKDKQAFTLTVFENKLHSTYESFFGQNITHSF